MKDLSGTEVKGYLLRELIGLGGFGGVYRAFQPVVERDVAIKIILPQYANDPEFIRNFEFEARLVARLEHPHIVPLYDFWRDPAQGAFIVMRLYRGGSLADSLKSSGPWEPSDAATMLDQIASALAAAHKKGVVHQDIKVANILLDEEGNSYLTDFGIAKDLTHPKPVDASEKGGELHGSPEYMSPEQLLQTGSDSRSDIYSLGIVLFELLTGQKPFQSSNDSELIRKQLYNPIPRLQDFRPELPEVYNMVIQRATDKTPRNRYQTPLAMAENFRQCLELASKADETQHEETRPKPLVLDDDMIRRLLTEPTNPYKGLKAFDEADAEDFFGREKLVERLYQRVRVDAGVLNEGQRFLAVIGPSGSGKSSAVKAGLVPRLRAHSSDWFITDMTPGDDPMAALESALLRVAQDEVPDMGKALRGNPMGLHEVLDQVLGDFISELVLVIDQFEEVFTMVHSEPLRRHFLESLMNALFANESRLRVIVTLRADFLDRPLNYARLGELLRTRTELVLPMSDGELETAIVKPAEHAGLKIEDGLVAEIVRDVTGQPGALPLLQYTLTELFQRRRGVTLTRKAYEESGGVSGSMTRTADELYLMMPPESKAIAKQIFLRLISPGEGTEDTRRRVKLAELLSLQGDRRVVQYVLDRFGSRRLLAFDNEEISRAPTVEIAHEALIQNWSLLREWMNENRAALRLQRQMSVAARDWLGSNKDESFLARGARLAQFEELLNMQSIALNEDEKQYLNASMLRRERENQRRAAFIAGLFLFSIFALSLAIFAFSERQRAVVAENTARSRELAIVSLNNRANLDLAALLSVEAVRAADTVEARDTLLTILQSSITNLGHLERYLHTRITGIEGEGSTLFVRTAAFSPDGSKIATAGQDQIVRLWDAESGTLLAESDYHSDWINALVFSADGSLLASAGNGGQLFVQDLSNGDVLQLEGHVEDIWDIDFKADGSLLASASQDGTLRIWNLQTDDVTVLTAHDRGVFAVEFSPNGELLASGGGDNQITLWNTSTWEPVAAPLTGHGDWVRALAFNPSGAILASADANGEIRLWSSSARIPIGEPLLGHDDTVRALDFAFNGRALVSGGLDGRVLLWDISTGSRIDGFTAPDGSQVWGVDVEATDERIVVAARSEGVTVWDLRSRSRIGDVLRDFELPVYALGFSGSETDIASFVTLENDITTTGPAVVLRNWDAENPESAEPIRLEETAGYLVTGAGISPDGTLLVTGDNERRMRIYDVQSGEIIEDLANAHDTPIFSAAISSDNNHIALGGQEGEIVLYDRLDDGWVKRDDVLQGHTQRVYTLRFNASGGMLASGGRDSEVWLWDLSGETPKGQKLEGHVAAVISTAFDGSGKYLVSGGRDNRIIVWDLSGDEIIQSHTLIDHRNWVTSLDFTPDGHMMASASRDGSVILWNMTGTIPRKIGDPLIGHEGFVNAVRFSPDGGRLISGGDDRIVIVWNINTEHLEQVACELANRSLSPDEWAFYMHELPYENTCTIEVD